MGPCVPFAPALLGLRFIVLSATVVCFKPNKAVKKRKKKKKKKVFAESVT